MNTVSQDKPKYGKTYSEFRKRVDKNQMPLVRTLRKLGCSVQSLHRAGQGVPDLLIGIAGLNLLAEVKNGKNDLTPPQEYWHLKWNGQVDVIRTDDDAIRIVETAKKIRAAIDRWLGASV